MFAIIGYIVFATIDSIIGTFPLFYALWALAIFLPSLAVTVRRLHDRDKSGWWILIDLIPFIGGIILLIWAVSPSDDDANRFGESPLYSSAS